MPPITARSSLSPRPFILWAACALVLLFSQAPLRAEAPGREPEKLSRASQLEPGHGAVIISVRSALYLAAPLSLFFVAIDEDGERKDDAEIVRFERREGRLSFGGNSTTRYKPAAFQLPAGRYRLAGHGAKCEKVPAPDERCLAEIRFAGIEETVSFPSRGYGEDAPYFVIEAGSMTNAGDFGLTAQNSIEWSPIPPEHLERPMRRLSALPAGPRPAIEDDFLLKYPLRPRSLSDDRGRRY